MKNVPAMSKVMMQRHADRYRQLCREKRIPYTEPRQVVLQAVLEHGEHPSADEVCATPEVRKAGISRATVYRALESLARLGALMKVSHMGTAIRYDGRVEPHHHFVCRRCNTIMDIASAKLDAIPIPDVGDLGFVVSDLSVQLSGLCNRCLKENSKTR